MLLYSSQPHLWISIIFSAFIFVHKIYTHDLVTSLELLYWDTHRYGLYIKNPAKELLLKQVLQTIGVPSLNERFTSNFRLYGISIL